MAGKIKDYASLTQSLSDWLHRGDLVALGMADYLIQNAQAAIQNDIFELNFGNGIHLMETAYGPYPITNGVAPCPTDFIAPKALQVFNGSGSQATLSFVDAQWLYANYPLRQAQNIPKFIACDQWQTDYSQAQTFVATTNQTVFSLASSPSNSTLLLVSLDGASLVEGTDYAVSGTVLTMAHAPTAGQTLAVNYLSTSSGIQTSTATAAGQVSFALTNTTASIVLATLDGSVLTEGTDYTVSGGFLTLVSGAQIGQTLTVYYGAGTVFIFGPYPDSDYTVQGTYWQSAPTLSATQTTNWMVLYAPELLHAACMAEAGKFLEDDAMLARWAPPMPDGTPGGVYGQRLRSLVNRDKARQWASGTLQVQTA